MEENRLSIGGMNVKKAKKNYPMYQNKVTAVVYFLLRLLVCLILVRKAMIREWESVLICVLTLFLMMLPSIAASVFKITLPSALEIIILLFVFSAEILGEVNSFYIRIPYWDIMLHTINGFCCAAIGFALVDLLNRSERFSMKLSPIYLAIAAFCFSMTIGVLWEGYEYGCDMLCGTDMQKDTVVQSVRSTYLDETHTNQVIGVNDIADVIIVHADGTQESLGVGGYLDVGLHDTMQDMLVNLVGAVVFSVIGYFYAKERGKGRFARSFIPQIQGTAEQTSLNQ